jgi:hypothetical protein
VEQLVDYLKEYSKVYIPIITFMLGVIFSRYTMSKKEKKDYEQMLFDNSKDLMDRGNASFQSFAEELKKYSSQREEPTLDDFLKIATSGENYFYQMKIASEAILSNHVTKSARDNDLVPKITEAVNRTLPQFYDVLREIANKKKIPYTGKLIRKNYESLYLVVEKYRVN